MAAGKRVAAPRFMDKRFDNLSGAITRMRQQIDGKAYVEEYVHSLTHELKTPITAISASAELMEEDLPSEERRRFAGNIKASAGRMARLVDRLLSWPGWRAGPCRRTRRNSTWCGRWTTCWRSAPPWCRTAA